MCFKWAVLAGFVEGKNCQQIDHRYKALETKFDFSGLVFPTQLRHIIVLEKNNASVSVNIFGIGENQKIYPIRVAEEEKDRHIDLLHLNTEDGNAHYCCIKNFEQMPQPGKDGSPTVLKYKNYHRMNKLPIVVHAVFESILKPIQTCESDPGHAYTYDYKKHEAYSFCIYVQVDNSVIPAALTSTLRQESIIYT
ncbi:hypothetical protein PR048_008383, partial [Dryococelus australis]